MKLYIMATPTPDIFTQIKAIQKDEEIVGTKKASIIEALRWMDTIHDFYPVDATGRGEDIRKILSRQYSPNLSGEFNAQSNNGISKFMDKISSNDNHKIGTISPSDVEKQAERYYKENFNVINVGKHTIDAKTIVDKYIADKDKADKITASKILEEVGVPAYTKLADMQLKLTDRSFFKANKDATNFLANVILTFFLGADINRDIYFLIDAAAGRLDCMFQDIDQVSTLINVLTIGDSAIGNPNEVKKTKQENKQDCGVDDFTNKFKRKVYFAAPNTLPYTKDEKYIITSNTFTTGKIKMWYQDAVLPFSKQNNASARLYVQYKENPPWFTEFSILASGAPNSGASVGTLKKLITAINNKFNPYTPDNRKEVKKAIENIYKYETQFNLTPILCGMLDSDMTKDEIISFLYDYKRAGDHEQANSANYLYKEKGINVILLTGDRLCSLYARLIGQPCIYIHKDEYDMYRNFRDVSDEQKEENARSLLNSRKAFILAEINKIVTVTIRESLVALTRQINGFAELPDKLEDSLYKFILNSLLKKIERLKDLLTEYEREKAGMTQYISEPIDEPIDEAKYIAIESKIKSINDKYNKFNEKYKELFNFALYSLDIAEGIPKNKFNSSALDYDNKLVKNILDYFAKFHKKNIVPGASRDKPLAVKKNLINRIGQEDYDALYGDLLEYLKKCNSYEKRIVDETEILRGMPKVGNDITEIWKNDPNIGEHSYELYKPIFDKIKAFIFGIIENTQATTVDATAEPASEAAAAIDDVTLPEDLANLEQQILENEKERLNLMKISLYDWAKKVKPTISQALPEIEQIYQQRNPLEIDIPWTNDIADERKEQQAYEEAALTAKITELDETIKKGEFKTILDSKLEDEYHIFYDALDSQVYFSANYGEGEEDKGEESTAGGARPMESDYIKKILDKYYANVIIAHYQELVDAYLALSEDTEEEKKGKIGQIYNYITLTDLYPDDVYAYLYRGYTTEPKLIQAPSDELPRHITLKGRELTPVEEEESTTDDVLPVIESHAPVIESHARRSPSPIENTSHRELLKNKGKNNTIYARREEAEENRIKERTASASAKRWLTPPATPPPPQYERPSRRSETPEIQEIPVRVRKGRKYGAVIREILGDIEEDEEGEEGEERRRSKQQLRTTQPVFGGKRTRRNKNKRNKKTRQQRRKTRKNKTLKRKKGKGKQTRRN